MRGGDGGFRVRFRLVEQPKLSFDAFFGRCVSLVVLRRQHFQGIRRVVEHGLQVPLGFRVGLLGVSAAVHNVDQLVMVIYCIINCGICLFHSLGILLYGRLMSLDVVVEITYFHFQVGCLYPKFVYFFFIRFYYVWVVCVLLFSGLFGQEIDLFQYGFQFFLGFRPPVRGHGQRNLILPPLGHDGVVLLRHGVYVLLVSLLFCALLPGVHIGPQSVRVGVERVSHSAILIFRGTDLLGEGWHHLEQRGQRNLVLPLLLLVHSSRVPHALQPVNVHIGHFGRGLR